MVLLDDVVAVFRSGLDVHLYVVSGRRIPTGIYFREFLFFIFAFKM